MALDAAKYAEDEGAEMADDKVSLFAALREALEAGDDEEGAELLAEFIYSCGSGGGLNVMIKG